jgi:hypothetical protein
MRRTPSDMTTNQTFLIALGILALLIVCFFLVFRGQGKFKIKTKLGEANAEGENPPPPAKVVAGVSLKGAEAGRNLTAESMSEGGVGLEAVKAGGDLKATHKPPK